VKLAFIACIVCLIVGIAIGAALERLIGVSLFKRKVLSERPEMIPQETGHKWSKEL
jgi:hypothetical protein